MADYRLRCRICGREFITYKGAAATENGRTCLTCWIAAAPPSALLRYGDDLLSAEPIPEAREVFPAGEPVDLFPLADALLREKEGAV
jgi:hypothetical protein